MKIKINKYKQKFEVTDGKHTIYVANEDGIWGIENGVEDAEFVFTGYSKPESLKTAKVVVKLLEKAIEFIEKKQREEK